MLGMEGFDLWKDGKTFVNLSDSFLLIGVMIHSRHKQNN
jgi:hypothetical protein